MSGFFSHVGTQCEKSGMVDIIKLPQDPCELQLQGFKAFERHEVPRMVHQISATPVSIKIAQDQGRYSFGECLM